MSWSTLGGIINGRRGHTNYEDRQGWGRLTWSRVWWLPSVGHIECGLLDEWWWIHAPADEETSSTTEEHTHHQQEPAEINTQGQSLRHRPRPGSRMVTKMPDDSQLFLEYYSKVAKQRDPSSCGKEASSHDGIRLAVVLPECLTLGQSSYGWYQRNTCPAFSQTRFPSLWWP